MDSSPRHSQEQFSRLLVGNQRRLYGFIFTLVQDYAKTDDILQDVAELLWKKFDSFELGTDFGAWAMRVARFKVLEWRRSQQQLVLPIEEKLLSTLAAKAEQTQASADLGRQEALEDCLQRLEPRDRELIHQRYYAKDTVPRIAQQLGRTRDAVYKRLAGIHRSLEDCICGKLRAMEELS